jgi:hypothetical protein
MLDAAREYPQHQFLGLDISPAQFLAKEWLPSNCRLDVWDALTEVPQEYVGAFDLIHIRTIYCAVRKNNVEPLVKNFLNMLKPGGYIQWDEGDLSSMTSHKPSLDVSTESLDTLIEFQKFIAIQQSGLTPDWVYSLPATLKDHGCKMISDERIHSPKELGRAWADDILMVWEGIVPMVPEAPNPWPSRNGLPKEMSRSAFIELFERACKETSQGATAFYQLMVFLAKKGD